MEIGEESHPKVRLDVEDQGLGSLSEVTGDKKLCKIERLCFFAICSFTLHRELFI